jgi:hypothetical protein
MNTAQVSQASGSCPSFAGGRKLTEVHGVQLWAAIREKPAQPSRRVLCDLAKAGSPLSISVRHLNRLRVKWELSRNRGRPLGSARFVQKAGDQGALVKLTPHVSFVGMHLFAAWMESPDGFATIVALLTERINGYGEEHPEVDFALLHHKPETLLRRFQALFYAPLLGIGKLSELDVKEHPLRNLVGVGYHSSTMNQFLGQLERINAGEALLGALAPDESGRICYVDGHMIAFWTRKSMHKGKITMLGRIMAGSQAVVAHDEDGRALFVEYYPPDIRMLHFILEYCRKIMEATRVEVFVIDREVNSVEVARKFEENGIGLLSMLDRNEYDGLSSWSVTRIGTLGDGSPVYEGKWAKDRENDPRHFVLVETADRVLPYWGTSKVKEVLSPIEWPEVYRERTEIQEYRFKEMKAHGALDVNYGAKKITGPDRHQQRACEGLTEAKEKVQHKVSRQEQLLRDQEAKVAESQEKGHTKRLEQRQCRLGQVQEKLKKVTEKEEQLSEQLNRLGTPRERADRDFRKQTIMTIRTLLLENALLSFLSAVCAAMQGQISLECLLKLLFERSGACLETPSEMTYWVSTNGLSVTYRNSLQKLVEALSAMNLRCRGKPIRLRLREAPT